MMLYDGSPERLWHYTSGSGAKGIFESRTLWAGHLGYMSDTSGVGHARATSCVKCPSILSWLSFPSGAVTAVWPPDTPVLLFHCGVVYEGCEGADVEEQRAGELRDGGKPISIMWQPGPKPNRCPPVLGLRV
jgi:hypothetical protein